MWNNEAVHSDVWWLILALATTLLWWALAKW